MATSKNFEADIQVLQSVVSKLDTSIEKIAETSGQISKMLAVHEQRLNQQEVTDDEIERDMKILHKRVTEMNLSIIQELHAVEKRLGDNGMDQHNQLSREIKAVDTRVSGLERWRWYVAGIIVAIATLANSPNLLALFAN